MDGADGGTKRTAAGGYREGMHALRNNGTVSCWGSNEFGQIGDGSTNVRLTPVAVDGLDGVSEVSLGEVHSCALRNNGTVSCWGCN